LYDTNTQQFSSGYHVSEVFTHTFSKTLEQDET